MKEWRRLGPIYRPLWDRCQECGRKCKTIHCLEAWSYGGERLNLCFSCCEKIWPTLQAVNDLSELR